MKKLVTLLLVLVGYVGTVSATDYYIGAEINSSWSIQGQMTDEDGDGTYSLIVTLPTSQEKMYFTIFSSNSINWANAFRPNNTSSPWITDTVHEISMLESNSNDYSICYPIYGDIGNSYNNARAIKVSYTPSTKKLNVTRLIVVASGYNGWSTTTDYLEETTCGSKVYTGNVVLEKTSTSYDDGFKFVYLSNGVQDFGGKNSDGYISNSANNYVVDADGVYYLYAQFNDWRWTDPTIVKVTASVGTYRMATLSSEYALDFTGITSIQAYRITEAENGLLTKAEVTGKVKANTGLFLEGDENASEDIPTTIFTESAGTNMLVPGTGASVAQTYGDYTNFILTTNKGASATPKFYKVNTAGNTVAAGKAYLQIPTANVGARQFFWFEEEGETTGVEALKPETMTDGQAYNLAGQRVAQPTKGLYIVNGKKYMVK